MKNLFTRKRIWIPALVLVVVIAGAYYAYTVFWEPAAAVAEEPSVQTAVARRGDLTVSASAAGVIVPAKELSIGFDESGTLSELLVSVGDQVESGRVLARLLTNNTEESIAASIANAELSLLNAQQALADISDSWQMDAAQALIAVEEAQQSLDDLQNPRLQQAQTQLAILTAQDNLDEATRARQKMNYPRCSDESIDSYQSAYDRALENYNRRPDDVTLKALNSAEINLNYCLSDWSEAEIAEADANLQIAQAELSQAEEDYAQIKDGPSPGELALAEAQLAEAQRKYERIKDGPDPQEIALAQAQVTSAESQLELAKQEQVTVELTSPMKGTVLSIDAVEGEQMGTSAFITIADLEQPMLEIYLDESDLDMVAVGFEIEATFDAIPDKTFSGRVIEVDPSLQRVSNVSTVLALAQLDTDSYAKPQSLPVGLNASVDVIGGRAMNAVLVPVEALREIDTDEYAVFVMENGEPRLRTVTVGLMDFTTAEITSGLEAGEVVTTGLVETQQ